MELEVLGCHVRVASGARSTWMPCESIASGARSTWMPCESS